MPKINRKIDLRLPQLRVLRALFDGGTLKLSEIGATAGLSGSANGAVCDGLAAAGLVSRDVLDVDGVVETSYSVTDKGLAALNGSAAGELVKPSSRKNAKKGPKALVPVFGGNRLSGPAVGEALAGCEWVGVPFAGGLSELTYIPARTLVANDLHGAIMNLAACAADILKGPALWRALRRVSFHSAALAAAQRRCLDREVRGEEWSGEPSLGWAFDYFICAWMARSNTAATKKEYDAPLSVRWNAGGGDSVVRFRNAANGLREWRAILARVTFVSTDAFVFLDKCKDAPRHGIYCDPPFPGPGDAYKHRFAKYAELIERLAAYNETRIVCRFYDAPLIRQLCSEDDWEWRRFVGRKQTNEIAPEVLLIRN